jgi:hypothetical protein
VAAPTFTNSNTVTITLASVTNTTVNVSSAIDNSSNKFHEALVQCKVKTGAASTSTTGVYNFYLVRSADGGTTYDDSNKVLLGSMAAIANATTYIATFSTALLGALGTHWKVAFENLAGGTTDTTAGNHSIVFAGVQY